jgi:cysteine desulfurase
LRQKLWSQLKNIPGVYLNGHPDQRLAGNLHISVEGVDSTALYLALQSLVAVSSGSACNSRTTTPSHVLTALGIPADLAYASVRFGIGRFNTESEIDQVAQHAIASIQALRKQKTLV